MVSCLKMSKCGLLEECKYRKEVFDKTGRDLQSKGVITNLAEALVAIGEPNDARNHGFTMFYRGHSSADYHLRPSIYREIDKDHDTEYVEYEDRMFKEMLSLHPDEFAQCKTTLEKLAIMQHYDMPTRLLDVTENPLIALYFACLKSDQEKPGMLFAFRIVSNMIKYVDSDTVSVLANIAKMPKDFDVTSTADINTLEVVKRLIHEIREEKPYFLERIKPEHLDNYVVCVKPRKNNPRIIAQQGSFLLFGIQKKKVDGSYFWTKQGGADPVRRINVKNFCIPHENKERILNELDQLNINESTVFPEMIKTAKYVKDNISKIFG